MLGTLGGGSIGNGLGNMVFSDEPFLFLEAGFEEMGAPWVGERGRLPSGALARWAAAWKSRLFFGVMSAVGVIFFALGVVTQPGSDDGGVWPLFGAMFTLGVAVAAIPALVGSRGARPTSGRSDSNRGRAVTMGIVAAALTVLLDLSPEVQAAVFGWISGLVAGGALLLPSHMFRT